MRRGRAALGAVLAAVLAMPAAACTGGGHDPVGAGGGRAPGAAASPVRLPGSGAARFYRQRVHWRACTAADAPVGADVSGLQCGVVTVPLDYAHPNRRTLGLAVARAPARGAHRLGSLVVNPGGPGASGMGYVRQLLGGLPREVRARFDVVGFDPRGVGRSAPVNCVGDRRLDAILAQPPAPRSPAEVRRRVADLRALSAGCVRHSGWLLPYVGTAYAARDLDVVRAAVGDRRLTYLGKSYGTLLGASYAERFPHRVRALVLDGALDPALAPAEVYRQQGEGFERDLRDFVADCARRPDCPLGRDPAGAMRRLDALLAGIGRHPLPATRAHHGPLALGNAYAGIAVCLYSPALWRYLRTGLAAALAGDGSVLMQLADAYNARQPSGRYANLMEANAAITCADGAPRGTVAEAASAAREWARTAPHFGGLEAWTLLQCAWWPRSGGAPTPRPLHAAGAPPILVVGTTRDPATPYAWAEGLARELDSGRLLGYEGDGHTAYAEGRSACVDRRVDAYLLRLALPPDGTLCH